MKSLLSLLILCLLTTVGLNAAEPNAVYELRIYTALPGKLPDVIALNPLARSLFAKYGMESVGYFVPVEQTGDDKFVYILKHASREAATNSWKDFRSDPEWLAAQKTSGWPQAILSGYESIFLAATDYSPSEIPKLGASHVYELRTYTSNEGKLETLDTRFRDHTISLFEKHGMTNVLYTHPTDAENGAGHTLVYLIAHDNIDAARASWAAFGKDPDWVTARNASEANGKILVDHGVKSLFLTPLSSSPLQ